MGWPRNIQKIYIIAVGGGAGLAAFFYNRMKNGATTVHSSGTNEIIVPALNPCAQWDFNWDFRDPNVLAKTSNQNMENETRYKNVNNSQSIRHIFLVRHGEYLDKGDSDLTHSLTDRGRTQAQLTGKRLKDFGFNWDKIIISTMTRAQETANILLKEIEYEQNRVSHCPFIREGAPIPPQPPVDHWKPTAQEFFRDGARIEAAFRRYFHRADSSQKRDSYTLFVGHANVIRYFVCRALQYPAEGWLRISLNHASITWLVIHPNGTVQVKLLGESGHMPAQLLTNKIPKDLI